MRSWRNASPFTGSYCITLSLTAAAFAYQCERTNMDLNQQRAPSDLFLVRMWAEKLDEGEAEWRGKVQHVTSGEAHYFRDWSALIAFLTGSRPGSEDGRPATEDYPAT